MVTAHAPRTKLSARRSSSTARVPAARSSSRLCGLDAPQHSLDAREAAAVVARRPACRHDEGVLEVEEADKDVASVSTNGGKRSRRDSARSHHGKAVGVLHSDAFCPCANGCRAELGKRVFLCFGLV